VDAKYNYNESLAKVFTPLWIIDMRYWHSDRYPSDASNFDPFLDFRGTIIDGRDAFDARKRYKEKQKIK